MDIFAGIQAWFAKFADEFYRCFIYKDYWKLLAKGLGNTLLMTLLALCLGTLIGVLVAVVRTVWDTQGARMKPGVGKLLLRIVNRIFIIYTTVIRGTPMMVQLMIMFYVVFASISNGLLVAILAFGLNSGAYVAEIFRSGIMSIDKGQMEAGRSVGLSYVQTMWYIIAPQVIKTVLPTLCNEFITLLKETSIATYVSVHDLTHAGTRIRGATYIDFMPLLAVALIYLVLVAGLTWLVGKLERRLRQSDAR